MPADQGREELLDTIEAQRRTIGALLKDKREPIAILGAGIRFPGGNENLDEFAAFLREGRSGIRPIPPDRWDVDAFGGDGAGKVRTVAGGFLVVCFRARRPCFSSRRRPGGTTGNVGRLTRRGVVCRLRRQDRTGRRPGAAGTGSR